MLDMMKAQKFNAMFKSTTVEVQTPWRGQEIIIRRAPYHLSLHWLPKGRTDFLSLSITLSGIPCVVSASIIWRSLPEKIWVLTFLPPFKAHLKTYLYIMAFKCSYIIYIFHIFNALHIQTGLLLCIVCIYVSVLIRAMGMWVVPPQQVQQIN